MNAPTGDFDCCAPRPVPAAGEREEMGRLKDALRDISQMQGFGFIRDLEDAVLVAREALGIQTHPDSAPSGIIAELTERWARVESPAPAVPAAGEREAAKWVDLFGIDPTFDVPAVPVVHPEPDLPAGYSGADNRDGQVTDAAGEERPGRGSRGVAESPAGKSHPEPGDRPERGQSLATRLFDLAEEWFNLAEDDRWTKAQQHVARKASEEMRALLGNPDIRPDGGEMWDTAAEAAAAAEPFVAAAVAAVRADLVAQVEALRANALDSDDRRDLGWNQAMNRAAALVRGPAAAVRSATKEES